MEGKSSKKRKQTKKSVEIGSSEDESEFQSIPRSKSKKSDQKKPKTNKIQTVLTTPEPTDTIEDMSVPTVTKELMLIGAHVSIKNGFSGAVEEAVQLKARSFAIFTGSQRSWTKKPLQQNEVDAFKKACAKHNFPSHSILPHGSYLINLGGPDAEKLEKSRKAFIEEMQRCQQLGLSLYNFHPGSHLKEITEEESLKRVAESINEALKVTSGVTAVIENTAGQGSNVGYTFEQIKQIIDQVDDKTRVGVCLDTCHMFGAGYDLRTKQKCEHVFDQFDKVIGFQFLKGMHLNDSKKELNTRLDRHANIGKGCIGLTCFKTILNDKRFENIPLILETEGPYETEIPLLNSLVRTAIKTDESTDSKSA